MGGYFWEDSVTNMEEHSISLTESPHYNHNPPNVLQVFHITSRTCGNCKSEALNQKWVFHSKVTILINIRALGKK